MDEIFFILLGALFLLGVPAAAVAGFVIALDARKRLRVVEARLAMAEARLPGLDLGAAGPVEPPVETPVETPPEPEPTREPIAAPAPAEPLADDTPAPLPVAARQNLEERLGTRWSVLVGGLALALGGVFLVRTAIVEGLVGPAARVGLGALLALVLVGLGEAARRRTRDWRIPGLGLAHAPAALTAAGAVTAFAVAYAAYALYGFLPPAAAFLLLGAIGLASMVAASLHGPMLAGIGLVAALAVPLLVSSEAPNPWALPPYLAAVAAAAYGVARLRRWRALAIAAAIGAGLWTLVLIDLGIGDPGPALAHIVVQSLIAAAAFVVVPTRAARLAGARLDPVATAILAGAAALAALALDALALAPWARIAFAGAMAALLVGLATRFPAAAAGGLLAAGVAAAALLTWPVGAALVEAPSRLAPDAAAAYWPEPLGLFVATAALLGLAIAIACGLRVLRAPVLARWPARLLVAAATGTPLLLLVVVHARLTDDFRLLEAAPAVPLAASAGAIALAYALLAGALQRRAPASGEAPIRLLLGAAAAASLAALAAGLVFTLDRGLLTTALALAALGSAFVSVRTGIPSLRYAVGILGFVVLMRLLGDPTLVDDPGRTPILNWLAIGYGVPALAFGLAARLLDGVRRDGVSRFCESLALAFAAFLVVFQIRHALTGGDPLAAATDHLEAGLLAASALVFALLARRIEAIRPDPVTRVASLVFAGAALAICVLGLGLVANPLLSDEAILGPPLLSSLAAAYLVPALLAAALAREAGLAPEAAGTRLAQASGLLALALASTFVALSIRHAAQGPLVGLWRGTGEGEMWAYSAALILAGVAALALGLARDMRAARIVGAAYLVAAAAKVFLLDLANLEGVLRAVSFIALGLTLVGIGMAYQRLAARRVATGEAGGG